MYFLNISFTGDNNVTCNEYILASSFPRNLSRYIFFHFDQESNGDCSLTHDELVKILGGMDTDGWLTSNFVLISVDVSFMFSPF